MMTSTHSVDYYSAVTKKGILTCATARIPGGCRAGEISQMQKDRYCLRTGGSTGKSEKESQGLPAKDTKLQFSGMSKF